MSTEHIVNRVDQTEHFKEEGAKLNTVWDTPAGQASLDLVVNQAADELGAAAAKTILDLEAEQADNSADVKALVEALLISSPIGFQPDRRFDEFRKQVILGFKHLGLDTVKFFPE